MNKVHIEKIDKKQQISLDPDPGTEFVTYLVRGGVSGSTDMMLHQRSMFYQIGNKPMREMGKTEPGVTIGVEAKMPPLLSTFLTMWLDHDLLLTREMGASLAVFVVRIDQYSELAARFGTARLEAAINSLGERLRDTLKPADSLARSHQDRFIVMQPFKGDELALHGMAKTMLKRLQQPISLGGDDRCLPASIGIAFSPEDGNNAALLVECAHDALRRTERWGGNGFCFSSRSVARRIADRLAKFEDLRQALGDGGLTMRFQPLVDPLQNSIIAVSGDISWQHREHGCLRLSDVASIAEQAGLTSALNQWVVESICDQLDAWKRQRIERPMSVKLSRSQLANGDLPRLFSSRLSERGLSADLLEVCIEHEMLQNETDHRIRTVLRQMADLGIGVSLTGIGVGPLALALRPLQDPDISCMSLAPSLTAVIGRCSATETMLETLINFIHGLGAKVRAVDISSNEQLDFLRQHGCDEVAGPLLAPALAGNDLDRLIGGSPSFGQARKLELVISEPASMH